MFPSRCCLVGIHNASHTLVVKCIMHGGEGFTQFALKEFLVFPTGYTSVWPLLDDLLTLGRQG